MREVAYLLVEGPLDEVVGRRLLRNRGYCEINVFGKQGAGYIKNKIRGLNSMARSIPFLAIVDLAGSNLDCAPEVVARWLVAPEQRMRFRVAVHEIESWLLADRRNLSRFLSVPLNKLPTNPDTIPDPKRTLVRLARHSRSRHIRDQLVPTDPSWTSTQGRGYSFELTRFVNDTWDPVQAALLSPSLAACLAALRSLSS